MIIKKIKILKSKFKYYNIDGYIIPKNDEYFSEYAKNDRLKNIKKNSFFDENIDNNEEDFDFNQDFDTEEQGRSPGWIRYQKRIK